TALSAGQMFARKSRTDFCSRLRSASEARSIVWESVCTRYSSGLALRRQVRYFDIAAPLRRGVAKQRRQQHGPLEIEADVVLVGESDAAMQLDAGLGDDQRFLRRLGLHGDGHCGIDAIGVVVGRDLKHQ